ncbi:oligoribonuclease [Glutamicibacter sp. MNS18]|uniref:oligoribonuclease n=1 Tax=Glutamicibacter sp. MNS18 TaxID=2989817 RepID=UPI0022360A5A|nr:oligoribonuclease [Glutamicibacter sp. MNS18]MCW4464954.1 oligoribonuclease [Glutamicibacter sp. MNS18]
MIVWIDCEMTGLDLVHDALIEVAVLITDADLNVLDEGISVVIKPSDAALAQMDEFVRDMHITSGLLPELADGIEMAEAERLVLEYITTRVPEPKKALLGGNSVGMDKNFLARDMPSVIEHLHYRVIDVSTLKELARRWHTKAHYNAPAKTGNHRALGDIQDSIDELKYYRATIMVPSPGPTSAEAAKVAQEITEAAALRK